MQEASGLSINLIFKEVQRMAENPVSDVERAVKEAAERLSRSGVSWAIGGSAGLMLRGIKLEQPPSDLDLYVDMDDAAAAHSALASFATDRPVYSETEIYRSVLSHYSVFGVFVELVAGFVVSAVGSVYRTEVRSVLLPYAETVEVDGVKVAIVPLAHELWFNTLRGREDRVAAIAEAIAGSPAEHREALDAIAQRNPLSPEALERVRIRLARRKGSERNEC
jgi:hypothetical protein